MRWRTARPEAGTNGTAHDDAPTSHTVLTADSPGILQIHAMLPDRTQRVIQLISRLSLLHDITSLLGSRHTGPRHPNTMPRRLRELGHTATPTPYRTL
ncbi:hypothetical protein ABZ532_12090 [Streptomyces sp. NPDC019396]|uniref:hypothetical protein n=1 Tax=Streptomyces sp. NPDC019396 TaxID=3154687 RepID=UPI0033DFDFB4